MKNQIETSDDPFEMAAMRLLAAGADVDSSWAFGPDPGAGVELPAYPWRRVEYRFGETSESTGQLSSRPRHPLIGARDHEGTLEWRTILDPDLEPALADHRVEGQVLLPGAALIEMGLAVARDWAGDERRSERLRNPSAADLRPRRVARHSLPGLFVDRDGRDHEPAAVEQDRVCDARSRQDHPRSRGRLRNLEPGALPAASRARRSITSSVCQASNSARPFDTRARDDTHRRRRHRRRIDATMSAIRDLDWIRPGSIRVFTALFSCSLSERRGGGAYLPSPFRGGAAYRARQRARARLHSGEDDTTGSSLPTLTSSTAMVDWRRRFAGRATRLVRRRAAAGLEQFGLVRTWVPSPADVGRARPNLRERLRSGRSGQCGVPAATLLIEGWATAAAYQLARELATDKVLDVDALVHERAIAASVVLGRGSVRGPGTKRTVDARWLGCAC